MSKHSSADCTEGGRAVQPAAQIARKRAAAKPEKTGNLRKACAFSKPDFFGFSGSGKMRPRRHEGHEELTKCEAGTEGQINAKVAKVREGSIRLPKIIWVQARMRVPQYI
jgi:hypothetical protein